MPTIDGVVWVGESGLEIELAGSAALRSIICERRRCDAALIVTAKTI